MCWIENGFTAQRLVGVILLVRMNRARAGHRRLGPWSVIPLPNVFGVYVTNEQRHALNATDARLQYCLPRAIWPSIDLECLRALLL